MKCQFCKGKHKGTAIDTVDGQPICKKCLSDWREMIRESDPYRRRGVKKFPGLVRIRRIKSNPREIYAQVREVIAQKGPGHQCDAACKRANHTYKHKFGKGVRIVGERNGDVRLTVGNPPKTSVKSVIREASPYTSKVEREILQRKRKQKTGNLFEKIGYQTRKRKSNPPLSFQNWHTFAGGTGAAEGKYSYQWTEPNGVTQWNINPVSGSSGRHRGYQLTVFALPGHPSWRWIAIDGRISSMPLGPVFRSPQQAASMSKRLSDENQ